MMFSRQLGESLLDMVSVLADRRAHLRAPTITSSRELH